VAFINDIGDGGSKTDKFLRDVRLLRKGLEELPNNDRYTFYLANSLKDARLYDEAIETYRKRIDIGGWFEEVWYSHFNIGYCYRNKGDMPNAISAWMDAYQFYPNRVENLHEIIHYYREKGQNRLAYPFCVLAKNELAKQPPNFDYLFMQKDIYDYKIDYELSIVGYYCNTDNYDLAKISMNVLNYPYLPESTSNNVLSNYKFYAKPLSQWKTASQDSLISVLKTVGVERMQNEVDFVSSTPSIVSLSKDSVGVNVRFVNYSIDERGGYVQKSTIETKNVIGLINYDTANASWTKTENLVKHDTQWDAFYVGLEDVRLIKSVDLPNLVYSANRGLPDGKMAVEIGQISAMTGDTHSPVFPQAPQNNKIEKNWVWVPYKDTHKMIYGWSPMIVGDVVDGNFLKSHEVSTPPCFNKLRGSTNGVIIDGDIWLICHAVSYEDRRYYYHMFVVLDTNTFQVKKYTPFFTFEKEKVEYTLGFTWNAELNEILIGYSKMDRKTEYLSVSKKTIDDLCM
jgi:hypothetical protein